MTVPHNIVVERISYRVFPIRGGKLLKTWAKVGAALKPVTASTEAKLKKKLGKISVDLLNGEVEAAQLDAGDHRAYLAARDLAQRYGVSVETAVREYCAIREILGLASPMEAARFFQVHNGTVGERRSLRECVAAFKLHLLKRSQAYREICGYDLDRMARVVGPDRWIGEVQLGELKRVVAETGRVVAGKILPASDYRRNQVRDELVTFFNFCRRERFLPRKLDTVAHDLESEDTVAEARRVWDPEHLRRALELVWAHEREWLPWLAINCFANVRSQPTRRLDWLDIHWHESLLELEAKLSKTKTRVTVDLSPALVSWIDPFRGRKGPICPAKGFSSFVARLRGKYDLPFYKNILRRSYITYLLAETDDEEYVARLANTSVKKVRANYRKIRTFSGRLVTKDLATAWFATARIMALNEDQLEFASR